MINQTFTMGFRVPIDAKGIAQQFVIQTIALSYLVRSFLILVDFGRFQRVDIAHMELIVATIIVLMSSILISTFGSFTRLRTK